MRATKHISAAPAPPVLSSSIIIQLCLPPAVKTALDNSLRRRRLHPNISPDAVMSAGLQTRGHRSRLGRRVHDFATVSPISSLPAAILLPHYGRPLPAGNPTCQPAHYSSLSLRANITSTAAMRGEKASWGGFSRCVAGHTSKEPSDLLLCWIAGLLFGDQV